MHIVEEPPFPKESALNREGLKGYKNSGSTLSELIKTYSSIEGLIALIAPVWC